MLSTTSHSTSWSASIRKVQPSRPSGGFWQARAITWASCSPANFRFSGRSGCRRRWTAPGKPSCKKRVHTGRTVLSTAPNASWICLFDQLGPGGPWSTFNRIWACKTWRAGAVAVVTSFCKACLCSSLRLLFHHLHACWHYPRSHRLFLLGASPEAPPAIEQSLFGVYAGKTARGFPPV